MNFTNSAQSAVDQAVSDLSEVSNDAVDDGTMQTDESANDGLNMDDSDVSTNDTGASDGDDAGDTNSEGEQSLDDDESRELGSQDDGEDTGDQGSEGDTDDASDELLAPDHWPQELASEFNSLPPEGRPVVNAFLEKASSAISSEWDEIQSISNEYADPIQLSKQFGDDPQGVISELASRAGLDVRFGDEKSFDDLLQDIDPDDTSAIAKLLDERNEQRVKQSEAKAQAALRREQEQLAAQAKLRDGFKLASESYPDLQEHSDAVLGVFDRIQNITPSEAYQLVRFDEVAAMASKVPDYETKIADLEEQLRVVKAKATEPVAGVSENLNDDSDQFKGMSPAQKAVAQAMAAQARA